MQLTKSPEKEVRDLLAREVRMFPPNSEVEEEKNAQHQCRSVLYASVGDTITKAAQKLRIENASYYQSEDLPWRNQKTPYRVFLAEFLLVRTRSDVVARIFENIVARYPDIPTLAKSNEEELAANLAPLGLRKRVPYLLKAAQYLEEYHKGQIPRKIEELLKVPGLGFYTAVAIAAFAFNSQEVPADVNILRFLSRITGLPMEHPTKGSKELRNLLPLLSQDNGGPMPENLLDFTRLICRSRHPQCGECPLREDCVYFSTTNLDK